MCFANQEEVLTAIGQVDAEIARYTPGRCEQSISGMHMADHCFEQGTMTVTTSYLQQMDTQRRKLLGVLDLMQQGTYGICQECGDKIPPKRLECVPDALLCVKCQTKVEQPS